MDWVSLVVSCSSGFVCDNTSSVAAESLIPYVGDACIGVILSVVFRAGVRMRGDCAANSSS